MRLLNLSRERFKEALVAAMLDGKAFATRIGYGEDSGILLTNATALVYRVLNRSTPVISGDA